MYMNITWSSLKPYISILITTLRQLNFNTVSHKSLSLFEVHYETFAFKIMF